MKTIKILIASLIIGLGLMTSAFATDNDNLDAKIVIKKETKNYRPLKAIGSGGNINKTFSISKSKEGRSLPIQLLKDYYKELSMYSLEERKHIYNLRADRADVIVPALNIYISIMRWAGADRIFVPKIGLADGLIKMMYQEYLEKENEMGS